MAKRGKNHQPKNSIGPTRKERQRDRRHSDAELRRTRTSFTVPMNAMVELASLSAKARDKIVKELPSEIHVNKDFTTGPEGHTEPIMIPDPRRGTKLKGKQLTDALARREAQARVVASKREQRRRFASLSPAQKIEHRAAGMEHRAPRKK